MLNRKRRRPILQALVGAAALLLQFALPALHPLHTGAAHDAGQHASASTPVDAAHHALGHDALGCVFCAAAAQGRASIPHLAAAPLAAPASLDAVVSTGTRLPAAPSLTRAAPRGPPALA